MATIARWIVPAAWIALPLWVLMIFLRPEVKDLKPGERVIVALIGYVFVLGFAYLLRGLLRPKDPPKSP